MALPLQFQLMFNWQTEETGHRMFPAFKAELNEVPIYRLIHRDFEHHYMSAGQLFQACGLTLTEGFFLFDLKREDFRVDFEDGLFPFCDIWVQLEPARRMARALGVQDELGRLLHTDLDGCYSMDSQYQMMHNWTVPSIPHLQYSTRALLESRFEQVEKINTKIRTQIHRGQQQGIVMKDRTQNGLVRWQVNAYEEFLNQTVVEECSDSIWDTLQGLLFDLQTQSRSGAPRERVLSDSMMIGNMPLKRDYLNGNSVLQNIYIAVMIEKMMHEMTRKENHSMAPSLIEPNGAESNILFHDRLDLFEQDLYRFKKKAKKSWEELELEQQALRQQLNELSTWKIKNEKNRKSERIWILLFILSLISTFYILKNKFHL
ncbi:hypothetical protein BY458DRAFT_504761 [Sporodiniella umbellata]|nr:hypothetical protein BY458DRAFT_504761 [Sporodiniella umbellata]